MLQLKHELLKKWREELGLTQEELGQLLNLKQNTISQWEAGQRMPDFLSILSLAKIHNKSVEQILRKSPPFVGIDYVDTLVESDRDIPRLLTEQAWFNYVKQFRRKAVERGEEYSAKDMEMSLEAIRNSMKDPEQNLDLNHLPNSIYQNICESMIHYIERCVEMMERVEQLEALPKEDKLKQAVTLHKLGKNSSLFKIDLLRYAAESNSIEAMLASLIEDDFAEDLTEEDLLEAILTEGGLPGDALEEDALEEDVPPEDLSPEEFAAAEDETAYIED